MAKTKVDYRKAERAYHGLWGIFIGLIVIVLAMICFFYVFLVRTIRIVGNERYTSEEVIQMSGLPYEESMFLIDKEQIRNNLETSPYLEVTEITRIWPFTVRITVHERVAVAYTEHYDDRLVLDEKGYILSRDGIYYQDALVKVTGWKISEANLGEKIVMEEPSIASSYATIMMKLGEYELLDQVVGLDIRDLLNIELTMQDGMLVKLGDSTSVDDKMTWLSQMLIELEKEGYSGGVLDLSSGNTAVYRPEQEK